MGQSFPIQVKQVKVNQYRSNCLLRNLNAGHWILVSGCWALEASKSKLY